MAEALRRFLDTIESNRSGRAVGVTSLCTAHPLVLQAAMRHALELGSLLLVEATSNQVDQLGGYTGMTPTDFVAFVGGLAAETGYPPGEVLLGGDHLGPNRWRDRPAAEAMEKARALVAAYASAGFRKLHLDASMRCADDPGDRREPLPDAVVAARAAELCAAAEEARGRGNSPVYVIGTEVPPPGGAQGETQGEAEGPRVTSASDLDRTVETTAAAFRARGLSDAWERVVAVVVQPGVEFGDERIFDYRRERAAGLSAAITRHPRMVYEAHSTDYQTAAGLRELVEDHFCILKVGPALTFALREAFFALEVIEKELASAAGLGRLSELRATLERAMLERPEHWHSYYGGPPEEQALKRAFAWSDRSRYYWPDPEVRRAVARLESNLQGRPVPLPLLSQYLPRQLTLVREGRLAAEPRALAESRVREVLAVYAGSCGSSGGPS